MKLAAISIALAFLASGCTSMRGALEARNKLSALSGAAATDAEKSKALAEDYSAAMVVCKTQMDDLRTAFVGSGKTELSLAAIGILAGSVVVPALAAKAAASKSAIAGWGGLAGAANAGQYALHQKGSSAAGAASVYNGVQKKIQAESLSFNKIGATEDEKVAAINALVVVCQFPPLPEVQAPSQP